LSIQIVARAREAGLGLTPLQIFERQTVAELASIAGPAPQADPGLVTGEVPLTPVQRWFFEQELETPNQFAQAVLLTLDQPLGQRLEEAVSRLVSHHDALRLRFRKVGPTWRQNYAEPEGSAACSHHRLRGQAELTKLTAVLQGGLNIEHGPLLQAAEIELADGRRRLFLAAHHLVVDGVSWRILLDDLAACLRQTSSAVGLDLPGKTTSYKRWAEGLLKLAKRRDLEPELSFWLDQGRPLPLPLKPTGGNTVGDADTVEVTLSPEETRTLLRKAPIASRTQVEELLVAAMAYAISAWTGQPEVWIQMEGHGREALMQDMDLSRTVGWFTALYPLRLQIETGPAGALRATQAALRQVPNRGAGYGVLRYLEPRGEIRRALGAPAPDVAFNYLGQLDTSSSSPWRLAPELMARGRDQRQLRGSALNVDASVREGRLRVGWTYGRNLLQTATVEGLVQSFLHGLRELIADDASGAEIEYSPVDFPLADLGQDELQEIIRQVLPTAGAVQTLREKK
jgi:non-ribosomal peptide synthase protein (TIGR01720 family)